MKTKQKNSTQLIIKLSITNTVPLIGVFLLDWTFFEIGIFYLIDNLAYFITFQFDDTFIDKKTRLPLFFGLIQFAMMTAMFSIFVFTSSLIIYYMTYEKGSYETQEYLEKFYRLIKGFNIEYIICFAVFLEMIAYYTQKRKDESHLENTTIKIIRKTIFTHLYLIVGLFIMTILPIDNLILAPLFIGLKFLSDYFNYESELSDFLKKIFGSIKKNLTEQ